MTPEPTLRQEFARKNPDFPLLSLDSPDLVERVLRELNWLESSEEVVAVEKPGEGNMNLTLRVRTGGRSMIVKQSRPWVEKYDFIEAPFDRVLSEIEFYRRTSRLVEVGQAMPRLLGADADRRLLLLEDLGDGSDLSTVYAHRDADRLSIGDAQWLGGYLAALQEGTYGEPSGVLRNEAMRRLNATHIFDVPMDVANGVDVEGFEPGLARLAEELQADTEFRSALSDLGERYLSVDGPNLLHGDFFPGSWLKTARGLFVIDPEFAFYGDPELDVGVAVAHLVLARQARSTVEAFVQAAGGDRLDARLQARYAGAEAMRRLLGVAQLPIAPSDGFRAQVLDACRPAVTDGDLSALLNLEGVHPEG